MLVAALRLYTQYTAQHRNRLLTRLINPGQPLVNLRATSGHNLKIGPHE
jgi:hypothetical protein